MHSVGPWFAVNIPGFVTLGCGRCSAMCFKIVTTWVVHESASLFAALQRIEGVGNFTLCGNLLHCRDSRYHSQGVLCVIESEYMSFESYENGSCFCCVSACIPYSALDWPALEKWLMVRLKQQFGLFCVIHSRQLMAVKMTFSQLMLEYKENSELGFSHGF